MIRIRTSAALLAAATAVGSLAWAAPAEASVGFYNRGVKDVDYTWTLDSCLDGQALPCTPNAGTGNSNVMRALQVQGFDGGLVFGDIETTSQEGDDHLWLAATLGAECRNFFDLDGAFVGLGANYEHGHRTAVVIGPETVSISTPDAQSMPVKTAALNFSFDAIFNEGPESQLDGFDSLAEILGHGEQVIADRMAAGTPEEVARSEGFTVETWVATHADVSCRLGDRDREYFKKMPQYLPLTIEFVGVPWDGLGNEDRPSDDLTTEAVVTDVFLAVLPDPDDECTVVLSGSISSNGPLSVDYRFLNPYGQPSNTFTVEIDQTNQVFLDHTAAIPQRVSTDPQGGLVTPASPPGQIGDLVGAGDASEWSGTFELEILSPNVMSDLDGFSVPWCPGVTPPVRTTGLGDGAPEGLRN